MKLFLAAASMLVFATVSFGNNKFPSGNPIGYMRHDCEVKGKSGKTYQIGTLSKEICVNGLGGNYLEIGKEKVADEANSKSSSASH